MHSKLQSYSPFKHLRVIELSSVLAGPLTGTFFAELGANVLKIENSKTNGDITRQWKSSPAEGERNYSSYYAAANYGKKTIFADLTQPENIANLHESIAQTDIVIVNFKQGDAQKFRLDYATLRAINPQLIYGEITGFGRDDTRTAYDAILQAETGFMSMNGQPGGISTKMPIAFIDLLAAHQLKEGILTAILQKNANGKGSIVSVSLYDTAVSSLANQASDYLMNHQIPVKMGSAHPSIAPYGDVFRTKDNLEILFAIGSDKQFVKLCDILTVPQIATDEKYKTNLARVANRATLILLLQEAVSNWKREDLYYSLLHERIPVGCIRNLEEVFDNENATDLILEENMEGVESKRVRTVVFNISNE